MLMFSNLARNASLRIIKQQLFGNGRLTAVYLPQNCRALATAEKATAVKIKKVKTEKDSNVFSQKKLLAAIAEKSGADENTVQAVLTSFSEVVLTEVMSNDKSVRVKGLGTFKMKVRNARKGRNPRTGEEIDIMESKVLKFEVSKASAASMK